MLDFVTVFYCVSIGVFMYFFFTSVYAMYYIYWLTFAELYLYSGNKEYLVIIYDHFDYILQCLPISYWGFLLLCSWKWLACSSLLDYILVWFSDQRDISKRLWEHCFPFNFIKRIWGVLVLEFLKLMSSSPVNLQRTLLFLGGGVFINDTLINIVI